MTSAGSHSFYHGKVKTVEVLDDQRVRITFTDKITAGDGAKKDEISGKGKMNLMLSNLLMGVLGDAGIPHHVLENESDTTIIARNLTILPVEVVVRNYTAGSFARRYGVKEGNKLSKPFVEFFLKDDELHDPLIDTYVAVDMGLITLEQRDLMAARAIQVNKILQDYFIKAGMILVDFKLEFGVDKSGSLYLADEISADSMRVWDAETMEKLDKDRFRKKLGDVLAGYQVIYNRLQQLEDYIPEKGILNAVIRISPKEGVTDPAGEVTRRTLVNAGIPSVGKVSMGKVVQIRLEDTVGENWLKQLHEVCVSILTNPLVEKYTIRFE